MVNLSHMFKYVDPRGLYANIKSQFVFVFSLFFVFLTEAATWLLFSMVIGIQVSLSP